MVAPFTPYSKIASRGHYVDLGWGLYWVNHWTFYSTGVRQAKPYVNTAYSAYYAIGDGPMTPGSWNNHYEDLYNDARVEALNKARAKFVDALGDASSFGSTLTAERRETYGMMQSAVSKAYRAARAVRRGNLQRAAQIFGIEPPRVVETVVKRRKRPDGTYRPPVKRSHYVLPTGRRVAKNAAGTWLWYSYGVKPLIDDCYNAVDVLQRHAPYTRVEGWGTGSSSDTLPGSVKVENVVKAKFAANVRVKNPNLWLANQMGLVNPIQMVNEAIPFSFVVDWFSNLSDVISSMTDFVGLEIADPVTAIKGTTTADHIDEYNWRYSWNWKAIRYSRELTIPEAKLRFKYERFNWQRGANAISLLVGFLKSGPRTNVR